MTKRVYNLISTRYEAKRIQFIPVTVHQHLIPRLPVHNAVWRSCSKWNQGIQHRQQNIPFRVFCMCSVWYRKLFYTYNIQSLEALRAPEVDCILLEFYCPAPVCEVECVFHNPLILQICGMSVNLQLEVTCVFQQMWNQ